MVSVAQLAERPPVARKVAGSSPVTHPKKNTNVYWRFLFTHLVC
jgi:hypothetical protein